MKILKLILQAATIYAFLLMGNLISTIISPVIIIPGSIIGMLLLFVLLCTNIIKLSAIDTVGDFVIKYMGFFYVPVGVGILSKYGIIKDSLWQLCVLLLVSCFVVMLISCKSADVMINLYEGKKSNE